MGKRWKKNSSPRRTVITTMPITVTSSVPHGNFVGSVTRSGIGASIAPLHMSSAQGSGVGYMWVIGTLLRSVSFSY